METEEPLKTGYLFVPPQSFLRKAWNKRFIALYKASNHGIQRLEIFDSEDNYLRQSTAKIIPLTDCVKVITAPQKHQPNVFEICTKTHAHLLSADSFQEMTEWLCSLQNVAFNLNQSVPMRLQDIISEKQDVHSEENLLYSSINAPDSYAVKILETEASSRCSLIGNYQLLVTTVAISVAEELASGRPGKILFAWPYRHIRRYGHSKDSFSFEAGRKCESGEGLFSLSTKDGNVIFQNVDSNVNLLKASHIDIPSSPSPGIDSGFFGRKSLFGNDDTKASPSSFRRGIDTEGNSPSVDPPSHSKTSSEVFAQNNSLFTGCRTSSSEKVSRPVSKPPRKSKMKQDQGSVFQNFPVDNSKKFEHTIAAGEHLYANPTSLKDKVPSDTFQESSDFLYDEPEERKEAWKTHGIAVEDEREHALSNNEPVYAILEENAGMKTVETETLVDKLKNTFTQNKYPLLSQSMQNAKPSENSPNELESYDHLTFKQENSLSTDKSHIYGKLQPSNPKVSSCEPHYSNLTKYTSGEFFETTKKSEKATAEYTKRSDYINSGLSGGDAIFPVKDEAEDIQHFMQNDAEYVQIVKKSK